VTIVTMIGLRGRLLDRLDDGGVAPAHSQHNRAGQKNSC